MECIKNHVYVILLCGLLKNFRSIALYRITIENKQIVLRLLMKLSIFKKMNYIFKLYHIADLNVKKLTILPLERAKS